MPKRLRDWRDGGHELHWKVYARNKRSIVLNLHHDKARMALVRLAAMSDVFIENFRPGTLEKMGLGPDALLQANPDLIGSEPPSPVLGGKPPWTAVATLARSLSLKRHAHREGKGATIVITAEPI